VRVRLPYDTRPAGVSAALGLSSTDTFQDSNRKINIDSLTPGHRAELRSAAHSLKPIFQIGKEGVTERAVEAVREAFNSREILKVKVLDSAPADARTAAETLASRIEGAHLVQVIGRTVVLFRPMPETK
jgi:RNA-binding protein